MIKTVFSTVDDLNVNWLKMELLMTFRGFQDVPRQTCFRSSHRPLTPSRLFSMRRETQGSSQGQRLYFAHALKRIEAPKRLSMTYDQCKEMSDHNRLSLETDGKIYFAYPHSPWQRGINENTNGLLRQYFRKGMDLNVLTQEHLDSVAWQLNTWPRKSMGWKYPAEMFRGVLI
jgi:IS30 family transposase